MTDEKYVHIVSWPDSNIISLDGSEKDGRWWLVCYSGEFCYQGHYGEFARSKAEKIKLESPVIVINHDLQRMPSKETLLEILKSKEESMN